MTWAGASDRMNRAIRDTFPAEAIHTPASTGTPTAITVVHDYRWIECDPGNGVPQSAQTHTAFVVLADLTTYPKQADTLTIEGEPFEVIDVQADGSGGCLLILNRGA